MEFEWDEDKNQSNQIKHNVSFEEATEIFRYPMYEITDTRRDYGEVRYIGIGRNNQMVVLTVIKCQGDRRDATVSCRNRRVLDDTVVVGLKKSVGVLT